MNKTITSEQAKKDFRESIESKSNFEALKRLANK
jgi:hypothetical protein